MVISICKSLITDIFLRCVQWASKKLISEREILFFYNLGLKFANITLSNKIVLGMAK